MSSHVYGRRKQVGPWQCAVSVVNLSNQTSYYVHNELPFMGQFQTSYLATVRKCCSVCDVCVQREMVITYGTAIDNAPTLANSGFSTNMSLVALSGAVSLKSINSKVPFGDRINMNPPL